MNEREHSGFRDLVSVVAVCGFVLLVALIAFLFLGPAQNWFGSVKDWLRLVPSPDQGGEAPQGQTLTWTDMEIKAALMQCIKALAPVSADVVPVDPIRDGDCGAPAPV